jgi:hypothetical protein
VPEGRPSIPAALERDVLVEAGHRCAIPTCRSTTVELAHIVPWSTVQEHTFDNLIALCPTCHTRYDNGGIDRLSMRQYKANLAVLNSRYGDVERRLLLLFAENPDTDYIDQPGGLQLFFLYLIRDGYLAYAGMAPWATQIQGVNTHERYVLTDAGRAFVQHVVHPDPLD